MREKADILRAVVGLFGFNNDVGRIRPHVPDAALRSTHLEFIPAAHLRHMKACLGDRILANITDIAKRCDLIPALLDLVHVVRRALLAPRRVLTRNAERCPLIGLIWIGESVDHRAFAAILIHAIVRIRHDRAPLKARMAHSIIESVAWENPGLDPLIPVVP